ALEDTRGVYANLVKGVADVASIAHQPARFNGGARRMGARKVVARRQDGKLDAPRTEEGAWSDEQSAGLISHHARKGGISPMVLASRTRIRNPPARASTSCRVDSVAFSVGFTNRATLFAAGTSSRSSCMRFASTSVLKKLTPVAFPPG